MKCPIINSPKTQGGTLYTFSSVNRDLNNTLSDSNLNQMKFSKFVALNIPDLYNLKISGTDYKNGIYLKQLYDDVPSTLDKDALNKQLKKNIQNYMLNLETIILNSDNYNNTKSYAESIFFKWLMDIGGIQFVQSANDTYIEKEKTNEPKVINYIGDIDITNTVNINGESYSELYLHIPSNHGQLSYTDIVFKPFNEIVKKEYTGTSGEYIEGRTGDDYKAIFDNQATNSYTIRDNENIGIDFDNIENNTLAESSETNFEFNTVLIYYDLFDQNSNKVATNLYGVLLLEEVTDASTTNTDDPAGYIQRYPKYVETGTFNGNSYGLKINIKTDVNPETSLVVDTVVSPNATHSMELFSDAMTELQKTTSIFMTVQSELNKLQSKVEQTSNIVSQMPDWDIMKEEIINLNTLFSQLDERLKKLENK